MISIFIFDARKQLTLFKIIRKTQFISKSLRIVLQKKEYPGLQVPFDPKIGHFIGPNFLKNRVR